MAGLPEGFVIDEPSGLPEGFIIDEAPDPIGAPLPSEQIGPLDHLENFVKAAGNEFVDVKDAVLQGFLNSAKAQQQGQAGLTAEQAAERGEAFDQTKAELTQSGLARTRETEELKAVSPVAGTAGQIAGEIASLPVPALKAASVAGKVAGSAAQGALGGAVEPAADGSSFAQNVAQGAGFGAASGAVGEAVAPLVRKVLNRGETDGPNRESIQSVLDAGERENVPVFFDDVTQSGAARRIGTANESVPVVGGERNRIEQNQAAKNAAQARVTAARTELENTGGDPDELFEEIQGGLRDRLKEVRTEASAKFTAVTEALDPAGAFKPKRVSDFIDRSIAQEEAKGTLANADLLSKLAAFRDSPQLANGGTFSEMQELRSLAGEAISEYYTGANAAIGRRGVEALQQVKQALDRDMQDFAFEADKVSWRAFKDANKFYADKVAPFKSRTFANLVKEDEPEKAWRFLVSSGVPESRAVRMYSNLTPRGRNAVRLAFIQEAFDEAAGEKAFSAAKMASLLEKREAIAETFFKGRELGEVKGFTKLMRAVERSGQVAENPPTGARLTQLLAGGFAVSSGTAAPIGVASATLRTLFQTPKGRDFLLASARAQPGTATFDRVLDRVESYLARTVSRSTADNQESTP